MQAEIQPPHKNTQLGFVKIIRNLMRERNLILVYEGEFTQDLTMAFLAMAERNMAQLNEQVPTRKKVFHVMVECLQNMCKHAAKEQDHQNGPGSKNGVFMVGKEEEDYVITSGNLVLNTQIQKLTETIDLINGMDKQGLKELHKEVLKTGKISATGGAGLGLIDIARKSERKLVYETETLNDTLSFFVMQTRIAT